MSGHPTCCCFVESLHGQNPFLGKSRAAIGMASEAEERLKSTDEALPVSLFLLLSQGDMVGTMW